jgi:hypothetical protein
MTSSSYARKRSGPNMLSGKPDQRAFTVPGSISDQPTLSLISTTLLCAWSSSFVYLKKLEVFGMLEYSHVMFVT